MERREVFAQIPNAEHVRDQVPIVLQLAACLFKRQHHQPLIITQDQDILVPLQLPAGGAAVTVREKACGQ